MNKHRLVIIIKMSMFTLVGIILFLAWGRLVQYKWIFPNDKEEHFYSAVEAVSLCEEDTVDVLFLGTSHCRCGVDPMYIYQQYNVCAFNYATSGQPIEGSYILLKHALKKCKPKIVFFDVSSLFVSNTDDASKLRIIDNMLFDAEKNEFAALYACDSKNPISRYVETIIPAMGYHDRWKQMGESDFRNNEFNLFLKGHYWSNAINGTYISVEDMNNEAYACCSRTVTREIFLNETRDAYQYEIDPIYNPQISNKCRFYLLQMNELCKKSDVELILFKTPAIGSPQYIGGAWTKIKSEMVRMIAKENDIRFLDLLYDYDVGLDWTIDTVDAGNHLNQYGAEKVSSFLGKMITEQYGVEHHKSVMFDSDLPIYEKLQMVSELYKTQSFQEYINRLTYMPDITILLSSCDDMQYSLNDITAQALSELGLKTNFLEAHFRDSYIAIIHDYEDGRKVIYEELSNRKIDYSMNIDISTRYRVTSAGWLSGRESIIEVNGTDESLANLGFNIVIVDNQSGLVIDTVSFDTHSTPNPVSIHDVYGNIDRFLQYEQFLMHQDCLTGIH